MLQKISKCEVKAWLCWNLILYRHSNFTWNQIWANTNGSKMTFLAILELLSIWETFKSIIHQNSNFWVSKTAKNGIFGPFVFAQIWFRVKLEWRSNYQISTNSSLSFTFGKFLEHCVLGRRVTKKVKFWSYKMWRLLQDLDLESCIFHIFSKRSKTFKPLCPLLLLPSLLSVLASRSLIWVSIPTKSSSTLWLIPGEVSMYFTPYFMASALPSVSKM